MEYVVITLMPEVFNLNPVVHGPFETLDEAEEFLERWINAHPGTRGIVRRLNRPFETTLDYLCKERSLDWYKSVRGQCGSKKRSFPPSGLLGLR
jgi:hypothetical protein